ncbi:hypothetical protein AAMO2058_000933700 [Amorphochlora amoebiformis]
MQGVVRSFQECTSSSSGASTTVVVEKTRMSSAHNVNSVTMGYIDRRPKEDKKKEGLIRKTYKSELRLGVDIWEIIDHARAKNGSLNIGGALWYDAETRRVRQILEGEETIVENLVNVIIADPRHTSVVFEATEYPTKRHYAKWQANLPESKRRQCLKPRANPRRYQRLLSFEGDDLGFSIFGNYNLDATGMPRIPSLPDSMDLNYNTLNLSGDAIENPLFSRRNSWTLKPGSPKFERVPSANSSRFLFEMTPRPNSPPITTPSAAPPALPPPGPTVSPPPHVSPILYIEREKLPRQPTHRPSSLGGARVKVEPDIAEKLQRSGERDMEVCRDWSGAGHVVKTQQRPGAFDLSAYMRARAAQMEKIDPLEAAARRKAARRAALPPHPTHGLMGRYGGVDGEIHIYNKEEKRQIIRRYLAKKKGRKFQKVVRYACRKRFADRRPRVGGRFIKMKPNPTKAISKKEQSEGKVNPRLGELKDFSRNSSARRGDGQTSSSKISGEMIRQAKKTCAAAIEDCAAAVVAAVYKKNDKVGVQ